MVEFYLTFSAVFTAFLIKTVNVLFWQISLPVSVCGYAKAKTFWVSLDWVYLVDNMLTPPISAAIEIFFTVKYQYPESQNDLPTNKRYQNVILCSLRHCQQFHQ